MIRPQGCGIQNYAGSYGSPFNQAGGGVYATGTASLPSLPLSLSLSRFDVELGGRMTA
jgi:hypothetical protein